MEITQKKVENKGFENRTEDINLAAAMSNSHFNVRIDQQVETRVSFTHHVDRTSLKTVFFFPKKCRRNRTFSNILKVKLAKKEGVNWNFQAEEFAEFHKSYVACVNEDTLLQMGGETTVHYNPGSWRLEPSHTPLPGYTAQTHRAQTGDPGLAAVLLTLGFPLLAYSRAEKGTTYVIGTRSVLPHVTEPVQQLMTTFRSGQLPALEPDHDMVHMMYALHHKRCLIKEIPKVEKSIILVSGDLDRQTAPNKTRLRSARGGGVSVTIPESADSRLIKKAKEHLTG